MAPGDVVRFNTEDVQRLEGELKDPQRRLAVLGGHVKSPPVVRAGGHPAGTDFATAVGNVFTSLGAELERDGQYLDRVLTGIHRLRFALRNGVDAAVESVDTYQAQFRDAFTARATFDGSAQPPVAPPPTTPPRP